MTERHDDLPAPRGSFSRRAVVGAAAWTAPAIALSVASPAAATSLGTITVTPVAIRADSPKSTPLQLVPAADNVTITITAEPTGIVSFPQQVTTIPGLNGRTPVRFSTTATDAQVVTITAMAPGYAPAIFALPIEQLPVTTPVEPDLDYALSITGPEILEGPSDYTVTVTTTDGKPAPARPVTLTAPADTTFGGATTVSGLTDANGAFTATLSAVTASNSGERELIAESAGVTGTLIIYIPSEVVGYDGALGYIYDRPIAIILQGILPNGTTTGLFQYRVLQNLVSSPSNYWIRSDKVQFLASSPWESLTLGEWYTGGSGRTRSQLATLGWTKRNGQRADNTTALNPRVPSTARLVMEFRRLSSTPASDRLRINAGFYDVSSLRVNKDLAVV
jgi:hypothetical protein